MASPGDIETIREEIAALAANLPFKVIPVPAFDAPDYQPEKIRQPRTYYEHDRAMTAIGRFIVERGTVELLQREMTLALFHEMHWCGWRLGQLAALKFKKTDEARAARTEARSLVSRIEAAEEELFIANRRMIAMSVKPYFWVGQIWLSDFLQEGAKAFTNAIRKFDYTRGVPFYSYSLVAVQNRLRNYFRDHVHDGSFSVKPSRDMILVKNITDTWQRDFGIEPTDEAVAKIADLPVERVHKVRGYVKQWSNLPEPPLSLDADLTGDGLKRYDLVEDDDAPPVSLGAEAGEVWDAIRELPERAQLIMRLRFIEGLTLKEAGQRMKLTRARIKQIQDHALAKVRHMLAAHPPA